MFAIPLLVGTLVTLAALTKASAPIEEATLMAAYGFPGWSTYLFIQLELLLGVALLAGIAGKGGVRIAMVVFVGFAAFSVYRALAGHESCGCFGAIKVHPWATFTLDIVIVGLLAWSLRRPMPSPSLTRPRIAFAIVLCVMLSGITGGLSYAFAPQRLADGEGRIIEAGGLVILEPDAWVEKQLPIARHLSPAVDTSQGEWTLLVYHHDCHDCQEALPHYHRLASLEGNQRRKVLLVEVPPYGEHAQHGPAHTARLSDQNEWFVQAPVEIQLKDGIVQQASRELPSISALRNSAPENDLLKGAIGASYFGE